MISMFFALGTCSFIFGMIIDKLGPKVGLISSLLLYSFLSGSFLFYADFLSQLPFFGFVTGAAITSFALTTNSIASSSIPAEDQTKYLTQYQSWSNLIYMISPLVTSGSILLYKSVKPLLGIAFVSSVIALVFLKNITFHQKKEFFDFSLFYPKKNNHKERMTLFALGLVTGIKSGIFWALFSVMTLIVLGSITYWGIVSFALKVVSIITLKSLEKVKKIESFEQLFLGFGIMYSAMIVLFLTNVSSPMYLLLLTVDAVFTPLVWLVFYKTSYTLSKENPRFQHFSTEYNVLNEVALAIGRIIPLLILGPAFAIAHTKNEKMLIVAFTFIFVSYIPNLFFHIFKRSHALKKLSHLKFITDY